MALIEQAMADAQAMHFAVDAPRLLERLAAAHLIAGVMRWQKARRGRH